MRSIEGGTLTPVKRICLALIAGLALSSLGVAISNASGGLYGCNPLPKPLKMNEREKAYANGLIQALEKYQPQELTSYKKWTTVARRRIAQPSPGSSPCNGFSARQTQNYVHLDGTRRGLIFEGSQSLPFDPVERVESLHREALECDYRYPEPEPCDEETTPKFEPYWYDETHDELGQLAIQGADRDPGEPAVFSPDNTQYGVAANIIKRPPKKWGTEQGQPLGPVVVFFMAIGTG